MSDYEYGYEDNAPLTAATIKRKAEDIRSRLASEGVMLHPVSTKKKAIATSFWGRAWNQYLIHYSQFANELAPGRTILRHGGVIDLSIERGRLNASVVAESLYEVSVGVAPLDEDRKAKVVQNFCSDAAASADVLSGDLSDSVIEKLIDPDLGLFPSHEELSFSCTCPGWNELCSHIAASLYGFSVLLDQDPSLFLNNYGFWAREYGATEQSIRFFEIAQAIDEELASKSSIAYDQRNIGLSAIVKGDYGRAEDLLSEALKTSEELNLAYNLAYCQFGLGDMEKTKNNFQLALPYYEKALAISEKSRLSDMVWRAEAALGVMFEKTGDRKKAEEHLKKSVAVIESLSPGLKTDYSRNAFLSDAGVYEVYDSLVALYMSESKFELAWKYSELSRARGVIDTIASQKVDFATPALSDLMSKERQLKTDIEVAAQTKDSGGDLAEKRAEYKAVLAEISNKNNKLIQLVAPQANGLSAVQKHLAAGDLLLEYHMTDDQLFVWAISANAMVGKAVPIKSMDLKRLVQEYREIMQNYSSTAFLEEKLTKLLIDPIASEIRASKHLIIVPHQSLHFLSFSALRLDKNYIVDQKVVSYLDSASQLDYISLPSGRGRSATVAAFGYDENDRLPFTLKEVDAIKRFFPQASVYRGDAVTKDAVKQAMTKVDILHIATHGEFNTSDPTTSFLDLAGDAGSKHLTLKEILGYGNNLDLVTLSACETAVGDVSLGDEIISLHKAFSIAGAHSVISNLWRINDVTSAVVMKRFYRALADGRTKAEALQEAQIVSKRYFNHPAYWASYKLVGGYQ